MALNINMNLCNIFMQFLSHDDTEDQSNMVKSMISFILSSFKKTKKVSFY